MTVCVIKRKCGENIQAGDVTIEVLDARSGSATIKVSTPDSVPVVRGPTRRQQDESLTRKPGRA